MLVLSPRTANGTSSGPVEPVRGRFCFLGFLERRCRLRRRSGKYVLRITRACRLKRVALNAQPSNWLYGRLTEHACPRPLDTSVGAPFQGAKVSLQKVA